MPRNPTRPGPLSERALPFALAIATAVPGALGCAEERPPINRVQPNALDKAMFVDTEWYMLQTVIDTPAQTTATFVGDSSQLEKIVWDIQEDFLIARQKRQHITGIEDGALAGDGTVQTGIVAVYAIDSHFDIRRDYNPTTGEELNVITENSTDRPWYERDQFRVDWSENLVDSVALSLENSFSGVNLEAVQYEVQAPDPLAPVFEEDDDGKVYYFDVVNKYFASPEMVQTTSGELPACYLTFGSNTPCTPGEVAVRSSFLRAEPDRDYEPMIYTSDRMDRAGYFLTWRDEYDPEYGVLAGQRLRFVNRHNLWEESHQRDDSGNFVACGTDADCSGFGPASKCDRTIARAKLLSAGQCTIPYVERQVRPVAYHLSQGYPPDLVPDAEAFVAGWNEAFQQTIGSLRELECERTGGATALSTCESERDREDAKHAFVMCHNPVAASDHEACGEPGTGARIGDVRFNHIAWVPEVTEGPLGYGPSFADPETGEIVSAAAYVYGAEVVRLGAYARDLLALVAGDLDESEVQDNGDFAAWINDVRSGASYAVNAREADRHVVHVDGADAEAINRSMSFDWQDELVTSQGAPIDRNMKPLEVLEAAKARVIDAVGELRLGDQARAAERLLHGTDIEELMVDDEMRLAAGLSPVDTPSADDIPKASPLQGMGLDRMREIEQLRRERASRPNSCVLNAEFVDNGLLGLVEEIQRAVRDGDGTIPWYGVTYDIAARDADGNVTGIDYDLVADMIRHPIFNAVTAHEVGHTLGLRHNFAGSYDSLNYNPKYWELRNDGDMHPRAFGDPMTDEEIAGRIREFQYSTVMDYGNNFIVTDAEGIGHYDRAAIKLGYGDLVEVFDYDIDEGNKAIVAQIGALQRFGYPGALDLVTFAQNNGDPDFLRSVPYTEIPGLLGGTENLEIRADVPYTSLVPDPMLSQDIGVSEPVYSADGRLAVPYRYCGDEFADYEPSCMRYDAGADEYETLTSIVDTYWNYYLLNNFQRQRVGFDPSNVPNAIYSRYFAKLEDANLYYSLYRGLLRSAYDADDKFFTDEFGFGGYTTGVGASYGLLTRVLATPEPGCHKREQSIDEDVLTPASTYYCQIDPTSAYIDGFEGRNLRTGYSLGPDSSFWFLTRAGYFQDKVLALQVLTDPGARVLGYDTNADIRRYQVSFYTTFQRPIQEVLRGVSSRDWTPYAARNVGLDLHFPTPEEQMSGTARGAVFDPNVSFALEIYSLVFGMAYLPRTFDYRFIDRGRIFVKGAAEGVDLDGAPGTVEYFDEESGLTYVAPSYPDRNGKETGIGASVLLRAQQLKDDGETALLGAWMANVNVLRRLTYVMGFGGDDRQYL